jgi:hypothetical protein
VPFLITAATVSASLVWAVHVAVDPAPFATGPAAVITISLAGGTVVVAAAALVSRARWSRWGMVALSGYCLGLTAVTELDAGTLVGAAVAGTALAGALGPWLREWLRRLPAAEAPSRAGALALAGLALLPSVVAVAHYTGMNGLDWALVGVASAAGWMLSRSWLAGLWAARMLVPATGIAVAVDAGLPAGPLVAAGSLLASVPAWHPDVSLAVRPIVATRSVPIPPELVDPGALRAAGLDDAGRPLEEAE